jgi:hypothetical protein
MAVWFIFRPFAIILGHFGIFWGHLLYFEIIWYIFPRFGMFYKEKSGNPAWTQSCFTLVFRSWHFHKARSVSKLLHIPHRDWCYDFFIGQKLGKKWRFLLK